MRASCLIALRSALMRADQARARLSAAAPCEAWRAKEYIIVSLQKNDNNVCTAARLDAEENGLFIFWHDRNSSVPSALLPDRCSAIRKISSRRPFQRELYYRPIDRSNECL
jgi:hypothetical protein